MRILMSEWQLQLKFENGEDMKSAYSVWKTAENSEVIKNNKGKWYMEPIELAKFGVDCSEYAS